MEVWTRRSAQQRCFAAARLDLSLPRRTGGFGWAVVFSGGMIRQHGQHGSALMVIWTQPLAWRWKRTVKSFRLPLCRMAAHWSLEVFPPSTAWHGLIWRA